MRKVAGAVRWWMPIVVLLGGTAVLILAGWMGGVDMAAAGNRLHDRLVRTFHSSAWEINDDRGSLRVEMAPDDTVLEARHDGRLIDPAEILVEDQYLTVTSLTYDDGELMYWRIPLSTTKELREEVRNPRWWRILLRVHPRPEGEPAGLRVARVGEGAAAAKAGVRRGDVLVGVEGRFPATSAELEALLQDEIARRAPGGPLTLTVEREGQPLDLTLDLDALVSAEEWEAVASVEDPVERYVLLRAPWRSEELEAARQATAQAAAEAAGQPAVAPVEVLPPVAAPEAPEAPPAPGEP